MNAGLLGWIAASWYNFIIQFQTQQVILKLVNGILSKYFCFSSPSAFYIYIENYVCRLSREVVMQ